MKFVQVVEKYDVLIPIGKEVYLQDGNYHYENIGPILFCKSTTGIAGIFTNNNGIMYIPAADLLDKWNNRLAIFPKSK